MYDFFAGASAGNSAIICQGDSYTLHASGGVSYNWDPPTGLSATNIANPVASPTITTTYTVTVTDINGCTATDQATVTVNPTPDADAGSDVSICYGNSAQLQASVDPSYIYTWLPTLTLDDHLIANPLATPLYTTTYTVYIGNNYNCISSDQVVVTVYPVPVINAGADATICSNTSYQINTTTTSGTSPYLYDWDPVTGLSDATAEDPFASPTTQTTYTVTVTDDHQCTGTDQITINIHPLTAADAGYNQYICTGQSATLTATGGVSYAWSNMATTASITVTPSSHTTYTVTVTDVNGCTDVDEVTVYVVNPPQFTVTSTNAICANNGGTATVQVSGIPFGWFYNWSNGATTSSISGLGAGTYTVTVSNMFGCSSTGQATIIYSCCQCLPNEITLFPGDDINDLMSQNGGSADVYNRNICINGTFTVNSSAIFENCKKIYMSADAQININPNNTLHISKCTIQSCDVYLWNRIYVPAGADLRIDKNSYIRDGKNAVYSINGGTFGIDKSTFTKNQNAVVVKNWTANTQPGTINKTAFYGGPLINGNNAAIGLYLENGNSFDLGFNNIFSGLPTAIYIRNTNIFRSLTITSLYNNHTCIDFRNTNLTIAANSELHINNNKFTNNWYGIKTLQVKKMVEIVGSRFNIATYDAISIYEVDDYLIQNNQQFKDIGGTAIKIANINSTINGTSVISGNTNTTKLHTGIWLTNSSGATINNNTINIKATSTTDFDNCGILNQASDHTNIHDNIISVNNYNYWNWWVLGIKVQNSDKCTVECNDLSYLGRALEFGGHTNNTSVQGNSMNTCMDGIIFNWNSGLGNQGSLTQPSDNYWQNVGERHTYSYYSDMAQWTFYVRDVTGYVPTVNYVYPGYPYSPIQVNSFLSSANNYCTGLPVPLISYGFDRQIAANELSYTVNPQQNKWFAKKYLYHKIKKEPAMLVADTIFVFAYDSLAGTTIGQFYEINQLITDTSGIYSPNILLQQNSLINDGTVIEYNHKKLNEIYIRAIGSGIDSLTELDKVELISIAQQCPYTSGDAVYSARVLMFLIDSTLVFSNECENFLPSGEKSFSASMNETRQDVNKPYLTIYIYPNPTEDKLVVEMKGETKDIWYILLYDINNKEVMKKTIEGNFNRIIISTKNFNSGIYFCKVMNDRTIIKSEKVVIIK
ncbi:MAG: T9SS type A sorting domain-containing protein [Bacteroidia bacterium]|nr:T9SS type A sorting domain-containing protein [Bacteroidia bacterium]